MIRKLTIGLALVMLGSLVPTAGALPNGTEVQTYQGSLDFPIDMAWVEGTRKIFFTEKGGAVRVMVGRRLLRRPCARLNVDASGEAGLLGIALHPAFSRNHKLYVYYVNASPHESRVTRYIVRDNRCTDGRHVVRGLSTTSGYHIGGQLEFVGNKLFVSVGEDHEPSQAQDTDNRLGKILRYNASGAIPNDNPFGGQNPVWSYGHRNPFGLAHKPGTNKLYETENGPSCNDELNYIVKGRNYGWGSANSCPNTDNSGPNPKTPIRRWSSIIVPTDPTWYRGKLKALRGLLMGDYGTGRIHRFVLNDAQTDVRRDRIVYDGSEGIVDVAQGPGGWLYFLTNNAIKRVVRS